MIHRFIDALRNAYNFSEVINKSEHDLTTRRGVDEATDGGLWSRKSSTSGDSIDFRGELWYKYTIIMVERGKDVSFTVGHPK